MPTKIPTSMHLGEPRELLIYQVKCIIFKEIKMNVRFKKRFESEMLIFDEGLMI